ncbi:MAG: GntR family transcriptional regulator [Nakamurella sp.]
MTEPAHPPSTATLARWRLVAQDVTARIARGEFIDVFPGELALAQEYEVSRHTIREALRDLRLTGAVTAGRGRPSKVSLPQHIEQSVDTLYSLFESLISAGFTHRSGVLAKDVRTDPAVAAELDRDPNAPLLYLERLRLADEIPLAVDRVLLPADLTAPLLNADFEHASLYDQLRVLCGIHLTGGQERIRAAIPTPQEQELLDVSTDVAVLVLDRQGCQNGAPFEWRQTRIRGDRFSVVAQFAPDSYRFRHSDLPDGPHPFGAAP